MKLTHRNAAKLQDQVATSTKHHAVKGYTETKLGQLQSVSRKGCQVNGVIYGWMDTYGLLCF